MRARAVQLAALAVLATTTMLAAACQPQGGPQAIHSPASNPTLSSPSAQPPALKPVLAGFLDRNTTPPASFIPVMGGWVVNVHWADIQVTQGAPIAANNVIDQAIATLHQIDPSGRMGLKVRLFAGIWAPEWAKSLGGPPISIEDPTSGVFGTIGRFWTDDFGAAYSDLQLKLAAKYDSAPEIREITISRCTTVYAEPFIRDASSSVAVAALMSAGFTVDADQRCHREEIVAHQVWIHTRSDLSFNPYQNLGGGPVRDEAFTESMMSFCRSTLVARCVLANNSLRVPPLYSDMYASMKSQGPPIAFQTAVLAKVGGLEATIQYGISLGAASVELPMRYQSLSVAALSGDYSALAANASRSAS
jgi:hypothetical protein